MAVPAFLAGHFDVSALDEDASTLVALDPAGTILWVNRAWETFARLNGGEHVAARFGPGTSYLAPVTPPLRPFYEAAFAQALSSGEIFATEYECSSADVYRAFHLRVMPVDGKGLLLEHSLRVERPHSRTPDDPSLSEYARVSGIILQCSNCRRVQHRRTLAWHWIPAWVRSMPPLTSHGLCTVCADFYYR